MEKVHIHLRRDGSVLALGRTISGFVWNPITVDHLQRELQALQDKDVAIVYSRDDLESDPPKLVEMIFHIIASFRLPMQLLHAPPVPLDSGRQQSK